MISGDCHKQMVKLHQQYGDVVRVAPGQVAVLDARAWKETMGHRRAGQLENGRDPIFYALASKGLLGPVGSEEHGRQRRILSHGFSAQSLGQQQPLIQQYVDLLMLRLGENSQGGDRALDMTMWYNWTTFVRISSTCIPRCIRRSMRQNRCACLLEWGQLVGQAQI